MKEKMLFRLAEEKDIRAVAEIYEHVHDVEEKGPRQVGWIRGVYPTEATARSSVAKGELYVLELDGKVVAAGRINQSQEPEYAEIPWEHAADDAHVMVFHTLVVEPSVANRGLGKAFVAFYEETARKNGCFELRMDTNARNLRARKLYASLGYREAGIVPCVFNGIPGVELVMLEKYLGE